MSQTPPLKKLKSQGDFSSGEERFALLECQNKELKKQLSLSVNYGRELLENNRELSCEIDDLKVKISQLSSQSAVERVEFETRKASFEEEISNMKLEKNEFLFKTEELMNKNEKLHREQKLLEANFKKVMKNNSILRRERRKKKKKNKFLSKRLSQIELEKDELDFRCHKLAKQNSMGLIIVNKDKEKNDVEEYLKESRDFFRRKRSISFGGNNDLSQFFEKHFQGNDEENGITYIPNFDASQSTSSGPKTLEKRDIQFEFNRLRDCVTLLKKGVKSEISHFRVRFETNMKKGIMKEMRKYLNCDLIDRQKEEIDRLENKIKERDLKFAQQQVDLLSQLGVFDYYKNTYEKQ